MKRCEEAEGSSPFFFFSNFRSRKIFATGGEFSLRANFLYYSENFVPAPAFLLQNKNKNKRTIRLKILKKILIKN